MYMNKNIISVFLITLSGIGNLYATEQYETLIENTLAQQQQSFANLEHKELGNEVQLQWTGLPHQLSNNILKLNNGLELSYGEIIYIAGDLIGDKHCSISSSKADEQEACFLKHFNALNEQNDPFKCQSPVTRVPAYRAYFADLAQKIKTAHEAGTSTADYYSQHGKKIAEDMNRLSCGGSFLTAFFPFGDYIKLAENNFDHFIPDAITAYKTGHQTALKTALIAHGLYQNNDLETAEQTLQIAYAQNAYANHFLSDAMSSGHMRTPRRLLDSKSYLPSVLNLLIANLMHDEDNVLGLNVHNASGHSWHAYGDGMLNEPIARQHRVITLEVMQKSADAVYAVFQSGKMPENFEELTLMPVYSEISANENHSPLFKEINGRVYKRKNNFDPNDKNYTRWWSGILTLSKFLWHNSNS